MRPPARWRIHPLAAAFVVCCAAASAPAAQSPGRSSGSHAGSTSAAVPPGALRIVAVARYGQRAAICAEVPGPPVERAGHRFRRTRVWVRDGAALRRVALGPGVCDPAWSPQGDRLALAAPDGLWVLSPDLRRTTHLVDVRRPAAAPDGREYRVLRGPQWSPDAAALAFVATNGRTTWVEVADARTGERRLVSELETHAFVWEADSRALRLGSRVVRLP